MNIGEKYENITEKTFSANCVSVIFVKLISFT